MKSINIWFANKFIWRQTIAQFENICSTFQIEFLGEAVNFQYILMSFL